MTPRLLIALATLLSAALLTTTTAAASSTQESLVQDDTELLERGAAAREGALGDMAHLGADVVRVNVFWQRIAPSAFATTKPAGFDATDPAAYPAANWDEYDAVVRGAAARGLQVLLTPTSPIPRWASGCTSGSTKVLRACKPDAAAFQEFVQALGVRYSGTYTDENGGGVLPRVSRWSIWNEPNQPGWLYPQYEKQSGRTLPTAAHRYRSLARSAIAGLQAAGHKGDQILLGETAPSGRSGGSLGTRAIAPVTFLRDLFCLSASGRKLTGSSARIRGCSSFSRLGVTGFAHHPYTRSAGASPRASTPSDWITIAAVSRLTKILDQAGRARRVPSRLPVHFTEFGFQTNPPDRIAGMSLSTQAMSLNWSDYIAYRNSRVRTVAQYKLNDDTDTGGFQTGLRFKDARRKPSWDAYRLPIYVTKSGSRALVYGQVRPAAAGSSQRVEVQWRSSSKGTWRTLTTRTVRSKYGHFTTKVTRRSGEFRLRWTGEGGETLSRTARVGRS